MHSKRFKSSKGNSIHNISSLRDMKGQRGLAREQRPHTFNNPNGEDSARTRAEIRERILKEAMSVLGEEEEFRPTTTTFRTKLHSSSNSSADSQTVGNEVKHKNPEGDTESETSSTYNYSDLISSTSKSFRLNKQSQPSGADEVSVNNKDVHVGPPPSAVLQSGSRSKDISISSKSKSALNDPEKESSILSSVETNSVKHPESYSRLESIRTEQSESKKSTKRHRRNHNRLNTEHNTQVTGPEKKIIIYNGDLLSSHHVSRADSQPKSLTQPESMSNDTTMAESYSEIFSEYSVPPTSSHKSSKAVVTASNPVPKTPSSQSVVSDKEIRSSYSKLSSKSKPCADDVDSANYYSDKSEKSNSTKAESRKSRSSRIGTSSPKFETKNSIQTKPEIGPDESRSVSSRADSSTQSSLNDQLIKLPQRSSSSSGTNTSNASKTPSHSVTVSKTRSKDSVGKKTSSHEIQTLYNPQSLSSHSKNDTPAYSEDEFLSDEADEPLDQELNTEKGEQLSTEEEKLPDQPGNIKSLTDNRRQHRRPNVDRVRHTPKKYFGYKERHNIAGPHESFRAATPTANLPPTVADLVNHCVHANDKIYQHALELADQLAEGYEKKSAKAKKNKRKVSKSENEIKIPHQFHHHYYY